METTKTIKSDSSLTGITENYLSAVTSIEAKIKEKNYILKIDGNEIFNTTWSILGKVHLDISSLTHSGRKKVAKRLWVYHKKGSIKSMNYLFHVLKKMDVIKEKISVNVSHKEAEIQKARKAYKKLMAETEAARVLYKGLKGDFYK
jgi:hypothetical protein